MGRLFLHWLCVCALGVMGCSEGGEACLFGSEGCACNEGRCLSGLACLSDLCVDPDGSGGTGGTAGGGGSGGAAGAGGNDGTAGSGGAIGGCLPISGQPIYVNPSTGVDDSEHGGGARECAVATIDFALTLADGDIMLAPTDYSVQTTIQLQANQRLVCDPSTISTLIGQPRLGASNVAVQMVGAGSGIRFCNVQGENKVPGSCISVLSGGNNEIVSVGLSNCGGAPISLGVNGATITDNVINSPTLPNIDFINPFSSGTVSRNTFVGPTSDSHVACGPDSLISGEGNSGSRGCDSDCNCPPGFFN